MIKKDVKIQNKLKQAGTAFVASTLLASAPLAAANAADNTVIDTASNNTKNTGDVAESQEITYPNHAELAETTDVGKAKAQLENAKKEHEEVIKIYNAVKEDYDAAKAEYDQVKHSLDEAEVKAIEAENEAKRVVASELKDKADALANATSELENAVADLESLTDQESNAATEFQNAKDELDRAQKAYDDAVAEAGSEAETELAAAKNALDTAKAEYDAAVASTENINREISAKQVIIEGLENKVASAKNKLDQVSAKKSELSGKVDVARSALDAAQTKLNACKAQMETDEYKAAVQAVETTKANLANAESALLAAQSEYETSSAAYDDAVAAKDGVQEALDSYKTQHKAELDAADTAKTAYDNAQTRYNNAETASSLAASKLKDAQDALIPIKQHYDELVAAASEDEAKAAAKAVAEKQSEIADITKDIDEYVYTAWDFYSSLEDGAGNGAITILESAKYAEYTHRGDANDATSIDNMIASVKWIERCNEIRRSLGLNELEVNYTLMAMAQSNANYSSYIWDHSGQFNVSENIAKEVVADGDPFDGWYTAEKAIYDQAKETGMFNGVALPTGWENWSASDLYRTPATQDFFFAVGHYLNIIDPDAKYTGYGVNSSANDPEYYWLSYTHSQVMSDMLFNVPGASSGVSNDGTLDVATLKAQLETYKTAINNGTATSEILDELKAKKAALDAELADLQKIANEKQAALGKAKEDLAEYQSIYEEAVAKVDAVNTENNKAQAELEQAKQVRDAAQSEYDNKKAAADLVNGAIQDLEDKLADAKSDLEQATGDKNTKSAAVAQKTIERDAAATAKDTAESNLRENFTSLVAVQDEFDNADAEHTAAVNEYNDYNTNVFTPQETEHSGLVSQKETAEAELDDLQNNLNSAETDAAAKKGTLDFAKSKFDELDSKYAEVTRTGGELSAANKIVSEKDAAYKALVAKKGEAESTVTDKQGSFAVAKAANDAVKAALGDWNKLLAQRGTNGVYANIDSLFGDMFAAQDEHEAAKEAHEKAAAKFAPYAASFIQAQNAYNASTDNVNKAQNIYTKATESNVTDLPTNSGTSSNESQNTGTTFTVSNEIISAIPTQSVGEAASQANQNEIPKENDSKLAQTGDDNLDMMLGTSGVAGVSIIAAVIAYFCSRYHNKSCIKHAKHRRAF